MPMAFHAPPAHSPIATLDTVSSGTHPNHLPMAEAWCNLVGIRGDCVLLMVTFTGRGSGGMVGGGAFLVWGEVGYVKGLVFFEQRQVSFS